ncbi:DUF2804 domain-containing protein [Ferrimonas pelagia]|uniref:DUF2804 domain-containing protein n=1 Tax=Ferrimonas pelagia TaxID=1177826 RepID=A0ABP9FS51_9GAMM
MHQITLGHSNRPDDVPTVLDNLMRPDGQPRTGHFDGSVRCLGLDDFRYFDAMDRPASTWARRFHFKQFQFISLTSPEWIIGVAIANIGYVISAFCYRYQLKTGEIKETSWLKPFGVGCESTPSPYDGRASITGGSGQLLFNIVEGQWQFTLDALGIQADLALQSSPLSLPLAVCTPTGYNGWTYTQKHNALALSGSLSIDGAKQPVASMLAGYDFSAGYMRRETSWRWASINAQLPDGARLGLNLAAGVNETGTTENALWIDGERYLLGPVHFRFERHRPGGAASGRVWRIVSDDGRVDLHFTPKDKRAEKRNLLLLKSNFRQYIGHFNGTLMDGQGRKHRLDRVLGLTEDHYAKW